MPWDALPEHIDEPGEWEGTDWDNWFQRSWLKFKGWFAYGPRSNHWWAKWRPIPKDILNIHATRKERVKDYITRKFVPYTSVIQYWERWHLLIQWPFHVSFHIYWRKRDVMIEPQTGIDHNILKMIYVRFGARFDNDQVYWFPSFFVGGDWN